MKIDPAFQINFFAFIGLIFCLLSLFLFVYKQAFTLSYLPQALLLAIPFCWKWKMKGFFLSFSGLTGLMVATYTQIPLDERFWHMGAFVSIVLSLLIASLSFREMEAIVEAMKVESQSRLDNLVKLDEKLLLAESELKKKRERIVELGGKVRSYQQLADHSAKEIEEIQARYAKLLQDHVNAET